VKIKEFCQNNKKKVVIITVSMVTVLVIAGGVIFYCLRKGGSVELPSSQGGAMTTMNMTENMVSASGVTSIGMTQESFEVENLETELLVEEVYASSNEEIEAGAKILKLSEESVEEARKELEDTLTQADLAYRAGVIEYEQSKITAQYNRDAAVLSGEQALEVYKETIKGLELQAEKAQEALDDAREEIAEYQSAINGSTYYDDYKVGVYKELYDENLKLLSTKLNEWGISWSQITSGQGSSSGGQGSVSGGNAGSSTSYVSVLSSLYSVLEQNLKDYEQALDDYEDAVANAEFELQTLELSLSTLEKNLTEAKSNYETQVLQAKLTYETALANSERAENDYETALQKAESDYTTLEDAKDDARTNLDLFESSVGDGYYYAAGSGTILRVMLREEGYLTSESTIFIYSNPEEITVTVSVYQEDISKISVGDSAYIQSTEYGSFQGTVTQINPVSSSGSRTSVTYNVVVTVSGDTSSLSANQTVTVIFGLGGTTDEQE